MPEPEQISDDESLRLLREFLRQLKLLLHDAVENHGLAIPGRHHENVWRIVVTIEREFDSAIAALRPPKAGVNQYLSALKGVGLTGPQLEFKISIFNHAYGELMDAGIPPKDAKPKRQRWWRRLFRPVLKAADVILGSLAKAGIPGIEIVKEFKETIEAGTELVEVVRK